MKHLEVRPLEDRDIAPIVAAFRALGWGNKPRLQYERYLADQRAGLRTVLVAFVETLASYLTIKWSAGYPPFQEAGIPEIQDFNVLPRYRREGIGTRLMDEAELAVSQRSNVVGIGVGMSPDYGAAQRLYALRGYVPDGRGLASEGRPVSPGETVAVDDGLVLYMTKELFGEVSRKNRQA